MRCNTIKHGPGICKPLTCHGDKDIDIDIGYEVYRSIPLASLSNNVLEDASPEGGGGGRVASALRTPEQQQHMLSMEPTLTTR